MKTKIFFNISLATIILSSCGSIKPISSGKSTVSITTNVKQSEISDNNRVVITNLKGESVSNGSTKVDYNKFNEYGFLKNEFSKKRRTLVVSHPYYNSDTIVIRRKLRPVVFTLDVLGAITLYLSPSLIIDMSNGNIWKVKKSDRTQNVELTYNSIYYLARLEYAKEKQTIESINSYLNTYKESPYKKDAEIYRNQLLKIKITNDSITKIKENEVIEKKIKLINLLIFSSLNFVKQKSSLNNINSLADALLIYDKNKSTFYSYLEESHSFEPEENKVLMEQHSLNLLNFHRFEVVIQEISEQFYEIAKMCSNNEQHNLLSYINRINDKKFTSLLLVNYSFNNLDCKLFDLSEYSEKYRKSLENYFPNITRQEFLSKLYKNEVFKYVWNEQLLKTWKEYYLGIFEDLKKIKEKELKIISFYNGQFNSWGAFEAFEQSFLYKTIYSYNIFQNLIEKNEYSTSQLLRNNPLSYFDTEQAFNFEKSEINWEQIITNDINLSNWKIKGPIEFGSKYFPEITTMEEIPKYNMNNWNGRVFYVKDNKAGFYKSEGCNSQSDGYCGFKALKPLKLLNSDLYEINIFRPKYIFKNDTIVLTLKLKDENNSFRYFHKYYIIKGIIDNPVFKYPSGKENENAKQSEKDIMNGQNKLTAVETELLLNKIDYGNYNPGTKDLSPILINVDFLFQDYDLKNFLNNNIVREFDKLNPFDPKLNLLENCNENTSEYNQLQLLFNFNSDNLFSNSKNKEKEYLGVFGGEK